MHAYASTLYKSNCYFLFSEYVCIAVWLCIRRSMRLQLHVATTKSPAIRNSLFPGETHKSRRSDRLLEVQGANLTRIPSWRD
jgi:hypothetical protein